MDKRMWLWYLGALWRGIRAIMLERTRTSALVFWSALSLGLILAALSVSAIAALIVFGGAVLFYFPFDVRARKNAWRLIRAQDRIEFATPQTEMAFEHGNVVIRLTQDEVRRSGGFDPLLVDDFTHFCLVEQDGATSIIPFEWIIGIELEDLG